MKRGVPEASNCLQAPKAFTRFTFHVFTFPLRLLPSCLPCPTPPTNLPPLMKAERRHELQTNTLALWLKWRAPEVWAKYGTHILLGIIVIALGVVLVRHLMNKPIEEANRAADNLAAARDQIGELSVGMRSPAESQGTLTLIQQAIDGSKRPEIQSEARLTLGDYYWTMFITPLPPGADTQPTALPLESPQEFLTKAEASYNAALHDAGTRPYVKTRAQFGLAAVAEAHAYEEQK